MLFILGRERRTSLQEAKNKNILLLFTLCALFAHRHTPDIYTKWTRTTSVIFPPFEDQTETHKNETKHHNTVFFNTTSRGSRPYDSPEGHGTTPSENCQRWSTVGPLGAAIQLTALQGRKPPRQMKQKSIPNDLYSTLLYYCKYTSTESEKCGRAGHYAAP